MLKNYLKVAWRHLARHKVYTFINIAGLAVGMAACLLILVFLLHETRFDAFHAKADRIYRLNEVQDFGGMIPQHVALSMYTMGPAIQQDFSEVEAFTRFIGGSTLLIYEDEQFLLDRAFMTDPTIFEMFDFSLQQGDPATALNEPGSAVLTEETAHKLFGDAHPMGRVFVDAQDQSYTVTGVLHDVPETSHLQFDALYSVSTLQEEEWMMRWSSNWLVTYLLLKDGASPATMEPRFEAFLDSKRENLSENYDIYLQPLRDVHLGSTHITHDYRNYKKFDRTYITIFGVLALFVLGVAAINFMNLSTARSTKRAREVGVRKSVGARRSQLAWQFVGESILQSVLALVLAIGLSVLALKPLNQLANRSLNFDILVAPELLLGILGTALLVGILAGLYPAFVLSSFEPVKVLKGKAAFLDKGGRSLLRNGLVVLQFAIAIAMITGTVLTLQQLRFLQDRNVGFDKDQVVTLPMNETVNGAYDAIRSELTNSPYVLATTASGQRLGNNLHQRGMLVEDAAGENQELSPSHLTVKANYLDFYNMEVVEGRGFSEEIATDLGYAFVVNEQFVEEMGWDEALGKRVTFSGEEGEVIGVVKDFNFNSLHNKIAPLIISAQAWSMSELSVRIDGVNAQQALAHIESVWSSLVPDRPFTYTFLDEHFAQLYASEQQMSRVVGVIGLLVVFIACLGLFGLASISTEQRVKEIGIRKAVGASVPQLALLLSRHFALLVGLAFLIAAPVAYLLMQRWLENFAYHINPSVWTFLLAGLMALAIALLTVSYRTIAAARANPVEALRYE
ncbi:MAG TPA: ABC transporter permease [Rhodothermales bacterium]|nr:ABC transporter permease [Rhodothermales bacterium]